MDEDHSARRRITVADPEGWDDPASGHISRADIEAYLLVQGWTIEDGSFISGAEDRVPACLPLPEFVAHIAMAEGRAPRSVLRDIEAMADAAPDTKPDPRPLFKVARVDVPREAGIAAVTLALLEADGYVVWETRREGSVAVITLRRVEPRGR